MLLLPDTRLPNVRQKNMETGEFGPYKEMWFMPLKLQTPPKLSEKPLTGKVKEGCP